MAEARQQAHDKETDWRHERDEITESRRSEEQHAAAREAELRESRITLEGEVTNLAKQLADTKVAEARKKQKEAEIKQLLREIQLEKEKKIEEIDQLNQVITSLTKKVADFGAGNKK